MSNATAIWQFLAAKGLPPAVISGIMGNLDVESGLNTGSYNSNENAHGLANWEGGRWTALQQFAASQGGSTDDLNVQLNFLWHELTTSYAGVLNSVRGMTDPSQVAAYIDANYEVSSGAARGQRQSDAQSFMSAYQSGGVNALTSVAPASAGQTQLTAAGAPALTSADYSADLDQLGLAGLLKTIPELSGLVQQAVKGGWAVSKFQQAVQASQWYKTHNASARELASLQASDPKEYATRIGNAADQVGNSARQLGVTLSPGQINSLAQQLLVQGWDSQTLTLNIGKFYSPGNTTAPLAGGIATAYQQVKQMYADYGVPTSEATLRNNALRVAEGGSIDAYKTWAISQAKSLYPSLGAALDAGMTVKDAASPYIQQMSNLLEIDPTAITLNDPLIKKALQGSVTTAANGTSSATTTTLYNFEQQLRSDPRWANTQNAKDSMSSALVHVGRDFGFGGF